MLQNTFSAIEAVSEICQQTSALGTYGDYFAYSQNVMISEVQLQLAKLYVVDRDSHSLPEIIKTANSLFTEKYHQVIPRAKGTTCRFRKTTGRICNYDSQPEEA